jgi:hypothetical protein
VRRSGGDRTSGARADDVDVIQLGHADHVQRPATHYDDHHHVELRSC